MLIQKGRLPGLKFGRSWIATRRALIDRLDEMATQEMLVWRESQPNPSSTSNRNFLGTFGAMVVALAKKSRRRVVPMSPELLPHLKRKTFMTKGIARMP